MNLAFSSSHGPLDVPSAVDEVADLVHASFSVRRASLSFCTDAWEPVRHGVNSKRYSPTKVAV